MTGSNYYFEPIKYNFKTKRKRSKSKNEPKNKYFNN